MPTAALMSGVPARGQEQVSFGLVVKSVEVKDDVQNNLDHIPDLSLIHI